MPRHQSSIDRRRARSTRRVALLEAMEPRNSVSDSLLSMTLGVAAPAAWAVARARADAAEVAAQPAVPRRPSRDLDIPQVLPPIAAAPAASGGAARPAHDRVVVIPPAAPAPGGDWLDLLDGPIDSGAPSDRGPSAGPAAAAGGDGGLAGGGSGATAPAMTAPPTQGAITSLRLPPPGSQDAPAPGGAGTGAPATARTAAALTASGAGAAGGEAVVFGAMTSDSGGSGDSGGGTPQVRFVNSHGARNPNAAENPLQTATLIVARSGDTTSALTVRYRVTGDPRNDSYATPGSDYQTLPGRVTFRAGEDIAKIIITPIDDPYDDHPSSPDTGLYEVVDLMLDEGSGYTVDSQHASDTALIGDDEGNNGPPEPLEVSIEATDPEAAEGGDPADTGRFTVSRTGDTTAALVVSLTVGGRAVNGTDYQTIVTSVTIPTGQSSAAIDVTPIQDREVEGDETVELTIQAPAGYVVTAGRDKATVLIRDDEGGTDQNRDRDSEPPPPPETVEVDRASGGVHFWPPGNGQCYCGAPRVGHVTEGNPHPIVTAEWALPDNLQAMPERVEAKLTLGGIEGAPISYQPGALGPGERVRFALQVDATDLDTGRYDYTIDLTSYRGATAVTEQITGAHTVFNWTRSPYGNRWWITDLDRIVPSPGGVTLIRGDGTAGWFRDDGPGAYITPAGSTTRLTGVPTGWLLTLKDGAHKEFNAAGLLTASVDRQGNRTSYGYTDGNNDGEADELAQAVDPYGRTAVYTYSGGLLASMRDYYGRVTTYGYDAGRLTSITQVDPDGDTGPLGSSVTTFGYDSRGLMTGLHDATGRVTTFGYDAALRIQSILRPGETTSQQIAPLATRGLVDPSTGVGTAANPAQMVRASAARATVVDATGRTTTQAFDRFGRVTEEVDPLGQVTRTERDADGRVTAIIRPDPDGDNGSLTAPTTTFTYDDRGNLTGTTLPDGSTRAWTYDPDTNQPTSYRDEEDRTTTYTLDDRGNRLTEVDPLDRTTTYTYDPVHGQLTSITRPDPDGPGLQEAPTTTFAYDPLGRVTTITYPGGATRTRAYDAASEDLIGEADELGRVTTYGHDAMGRLTSVTGPDPDGAGPLPAPVTAYAYRADGSLERVVDPLGRATTYGYDAGGRLADVTRPAPAGAATPAAPVPVVDDGQAGYSQAGAWTTAADDPLSYGSTYRYAAAGTGSATASWQVDAAPGTYDVQVSWTAAANRASDAPYRIYDGTILIKTVRVDQRQAPSGATVGGKAFQSLGVVAAAAGRLRVELGDDADGYVVADAARVAAAAPAPVVDDIQAGFSQAGAWTTAADDPLHSFGPTYRYAPAGTGSATASWQLETAPGSYDVRVSWTAQANRASNAPYRIYDGATLIKTVRVDQRLAPSGPAIGGRAFRSLGVVSVAGPLKVVLGDDADGYVIADAALATAAAPPALDDGQAGYSQAGAWTTAADDPLYSFGPTYRYAAAGDGSATATWSFAVAAPVRHDVLVSWTAATNRASNAPYRIYDGNTLIKTVRVDQRQAPSGPTVDGRAFQSLGSVAVATGPLRVELGNDADGFVIADAVRVAAAAPLTIVDDGQAGYSQAGAWTTAGDIPASFGPTYRHAQAGDGSAAATWSFAAAAPGRYEVQVSWTADDDRATDAPYRIYDGETLLKEMRVDQEQAPAGSNVGGKAFRSLGVVSVSTGPLRVVLGNDANGLVAADAALIVAAPPVVVDDGQAGYSQKGPWVTATDFPTSYGPSYRYDFAAAGNGSATATWQADATAGSYEVQVSWTAAGNRASNAPYRIYDGATLLKEVRLDQRQAPAGPAVAGVAFQSLGVVAVATGPLRVELSNDADSYVIADAARFERLMDPPATRYAYDPEGRPTAVTDPLGRMTAYGYDGAGRPETVTGPDPDGPGAQAAPTTTYTYDNLGRVTAATDPLGRTTTYGYDARDRLTTVIAPDPDGGGELTAPVTRYGYDRVGRRTAVTDPLGRVTTFAYDKAGQLIGVMRPDPDGAGTAQPSPVTTYAYDGLGRLTTVTLPDPDGDAGTLAAPMVRYGYDGRDRLTTVIAPDPDGDGTQATSPVTTYGYDAAGNRTTVTDPLSRVTTSVYDALDRLTTVIAPDPDGNGTQQSPVTTYGYDAVGNRVRVADPLGHVTTYAYDALDRLATVTLPDPDGAGAQAAPVVRYAYDPAGHRVAETDPLGHVTASAYDAPGRLVAVTQPDPDGPGTLAAPTTRLEYDAAGRRTAVTDPANNRTAFGYDAMGRLTTVTDPRQAVTTLVYDAADQLTERVDRLGRRTGFTYDGLGRRTAEEWLDGTNPPERTITYTYDALDRLTGVVDPDATLAFTYDGLGRELTAATAGPGPDVTLTSSYDAAGNRTGLADDLSGAGGAGAGVTTYAYDALDRLTAITRSLGGTAGPQVSFGYDAADRLTALSRTVGGAVPAVASTLVYDALDRLTTLTHQVQGGAALASYGYGYDAAGRLTGETNAEGSVTYAYDATGQLTGADRPAGQADETYTYDLAGNRTMAGYATGTGNRLEAAPGVTLAYDAEGNLVSKTEATTGRVTTFAYDRRNRLTGATVKDSAGAVVGQATYTYDARDRRIGTTVDADGAGSQVPATTWTVYDGENPYADFDDAGALRTRYLHGPAVDFLLARTSASGATAWYLADRQGSVRDLVDPSGAGLYHTGYDGFGTKINQSGTGGDRFGYTGRELDAVTGLQYNRARYYDAAIGRWTQEDPIGFAAGDANLYRYVGNAPTNATDPSGLYGWASWTGDFLGALPGAIGETFMSGEAADSVIGYSAGLYDHSLATPLSWVTGRDMTSGAEPLYGHADAFQNGHVVGDGTGYVMDAAMLASGIQGAVAGAQALRASGGLMRGGQLLLSNGQLVNIVIVNGRAAVVAAETLANVGVAGAATANLPQNACSTGTTAPSAPSTKVHSDGSIRTPDGKFAGKTGTVPGTPGVQQAEEIVNKRPGWRVVGKEISVRDANGTLRRYDLVAQNAKGEYVGIEVKSGTATRGAQQRQVDASLRANGGFDTVGSRAADAGIDRITEVEALKVP